MGCMLLHDGVYLSFFEAVFGMKKWTFGASEVQACNRRRCKNLEKTENIIKNRMAPFCQNLGLQPFPHNQSAKRHSCTEPHRQGPEVPQAVYRFTENWDSPSRSLEKNTNSSAKGPKLKKSPEVRKTRTTSNLGFGCLYLC